MSHRRRRAGMKENSTPAAPIPRKYPAQKASRISTPARNHGRAPREIDDDDAEVGIKCTGKSCQSCTAGLIADCVAVCCCPFAVVNIFVFAFFKVPWTMGKRILKIGKSKERKCEKAESDGVSTSGGGAPEQKWSADLLLTGLGDEWLKEKINGGRFEEEENWFDLYRGDQLGFGRVSFGGVSSLNT